MHSAQKEDHGSYTGVAEIVLFLYQYIIPKQKQPGYKKVQSSIVNGYKQSNLISGKAEKLRITLYFLNDIQ